MDLTSKNKERLDQELPLLQVEKQGKKTKKEETNKGMAHKCVCKYN
jgi:hypothetical protein